MLDQDVAVWVAFNPPLVEGGEVLVNFSSSSSQRQLAVSFYAETLVRFQQNFNTTINCTTPVSTLELVGN